MITNETKFRSIERLRRMLMFLAAIAIAALAYWNTTLPVVYAYLATVIIIITLFVLVYHLITGMAFFSFEEVGDVMIFKYLSAGDFSFKRMKISISQADFAGFKLHRSFFNLRTQLVLSEWINNRKAAYPPLNISLLSKQQQKQLMLVLQKYTPND